MFLFLGVKKESNNLQNVRLAYPAELKAQFLQLAAGFYFLGRHKSAPVGVKNDFHLHFTVSLK